MYLRIATGPNTYTAKKGDGEAMKVIRLTYRDSEMEPSVYLLLFFRLAGVYVYERFWGMGAIQMEGIDVTDREWNRRLEIFEAYDCDVYIVQDERDHLEYKRLSNKETVPEILLSKGLEIKDAIDYKIINNLVLVYQINEALFSRGIITSDEKTELDALADIYNSRELMNLILRDKYFFTHNDEGQLCEDLEQYDETIGDLVKWLSDNECTWGDRRYFHMQYAVLNMIYELNCLCARYKKKLEYRRDSLLRLCNFLETRIDGLLGDSVKMLVGQIFDDLYRNPNAAYERYVNCCNENTIYNSYVYFRKGNYWQDFGEDWEQALKYYTQAVVIYPPYYRAWYKIGLCNRKLGRNRQAVSAYENVRKCLANRIEGKCVRPLEIEHIFKAQVQIAEIWEKNGNRDNAIRELNWAERVWDLIEETSFYGLMCSNVQGQNYYKNITRENLDIENVYERMIVLNTDIGNREAVLHYQEKLSR